MTAFRSSLLLLIVGFVVVACGQAHEPMPGTVAPTPTTTSSPPPPKPLIPFANWTADAVVIRVMGNRGACGWGTTAGETRTGVQWNVTIAEHSISLDEDMRNWPTDDVPFTGEINGRQFSAESPSAPDYLKYVCQFRGGTLSGTFNADRTAFEATETLAWGPPGGDTMVQRHWTGSRMAATQ